MEEAGELFMIRPNQQLSINRLEKDSEKYNIVYQEGLKDGKKNMTALKAYLER